MLDVQELWRDLFSYIAVTALVILLVFRTRLQGLMRRRSGRAPATVADLPAVEMEWQSDVNVFDAPDKFGYRIYTIRHDRIVEAASLPVASGDAERRQLLNRQIEKNTEVTNRLAALLRERGIGAGTSTAILIDHSGSLRKSVDPASDHVEDRKTIVNDDSGAAFAAGVAVSIALALEQCGVTTEILGFTTTEWKGGQSRRDWHEAGRPRYPGRLNDLLHIIYKSADEPSVAECSERLEAFFNPGLLKENIDGEAIAWARSRLLDQSVSDRLLIVVSDGAPVDDSTIQANGPRYLERHLIHAVTDISRRRDLRIVGIGIGFEVWRFYPQSELAGVNEEDFASRIDAIANLISGSRTEAVTKATEFGE